MWWQSRPASANARGLPSTTRCEFKTARFALLLRSISTWEDDSRRRAQSGRVELIVSKGRKRGGWGWEGQICPPAAPEETNETSEILFKKCSDQKQRANVAAEITQHARPTPRPKRKIEKNFSPNFFDAESTLPRPKNSKSP